MTHYKKILKQIANARLNSSLTFFVGAGISKLSGVPLWKDLVIEIAQEIGYKKDEIENVNSDDFLKIPQMFYYQLLKKNNDKYKTKKEYNSFIKKIIDHKRIHDEIYKLIFSFVPDSIITTNFDSFIEDYAIENNLLYTKISSNNDVNKFKNQNCIIKMHGDFESGDIVLKEEDYLNYSKNFELVESIVKSSFLMNTIIFIGYGINDINVKMILNWVKNFNLPINKPIFINIDKPLNKNERSYHESRGLQIIETKLLSGYTKDLNYFDKYKFILKYLLENSGDLFSTNDNENFEIIFKKLNVYKELTILKKEMIHEIVNDYFYLTEFSLTLKDYKYNVLKKFINICNNESRFDKLELEKFEYIKSILVKANIYKIFYGEEVCILANKIEYKYNQELIKFNFLSMEQFHANDTLESKYRKAFFLTKLFEFDEAMSIYKIVYHESLVQKKYVLQYLCYLNIQYLNKIISFRNLYNCKNKDIEDLDLIDISIDLSPKYSSLLFKSLNKYFDFNAVYRESNDLYRKIENLEKVIINRQTEYGFSSIIKADSTMYSFVSFFIGNMLLYDNFVEFKKPIKEMLSKKILYDQAMKNRKFENEIFPISNEMLKYSFNEIDFYCLISCFDKNELEEILKKTKDHYIIFEDSKQIIDNIKNYLLYVKSKEMFCNEDFYKRNYFLNIIEKMYVYLKYQQLSKDDFSFFYDICLNIVMALFLSMM